MTKPKTDGADGRADHDLEYHGPSAGNEALFEVYEASVATGMDTGKFGDLVAKVWTPWGRVSLLLVLLIVIVLVTRVV